MSRGVRYRLLGSSTSDHVAPSMRLQVLTCHSCHASIPLSPASVSPRSIPRPFNALNLVAEDTRIAHPSPADATSARRLDSCHAMSCHARRARHLASRAPFGTMPYWTRILLHIGLFYPLLYIPLSFFRPRPPALFASLSSSYLAIGHRMSPLPLHRYSPRVAYLYKL